MKLKKVLKILPSWETIRVWGKDEEKPLYHGTVSGLPRSLESLKLELDGETESYIEVRYGCSDIEDHVAVFVKED